MLLLEANEGFTTGAQGKPQGTKDQNFMPGSAASSTDTSSASAEGHRGGATPVPPASPGMAGRGKPSGSAKNPMALNKQASGLVSAAREDRERQDGASGSLHPTHGTTGGGDGAQPVLRAERPSSAEGGEPKIFQGCPPAHSEPWEW